MFIVALGVFIWGFNFLKGMDVFTQETVLYGEYKKVDGLVTSNPVMMNGMKVGQVKDVYFNPDMSGDIVVEMSLNTKFPIPKNSVAEIYSADLMGSKAVGIRIGDSQAVVESGDTLQTLIEEGIKEAVNRQVQPLKNKAENLIESIDTVVMAVQAVFSRGAREDLISSFEHIKSTLNNLQHATYQVDTFIYAETNRLSSIIHNLDEITQEIEANKHEIGNTLENLSAVSDSLAAADIPATFRAARNSLNELNSVLAKVNEGEGTAGQLINDRELYDKLTETADAMEALLRDVKENPKKFVKFSIF